MIKTTDRILRTGKGQRLFFVAALAKLLAISLGVYLVSRVSGTAVLYYMLGLSAMVLAIAVEGVYQLRMKRSIPNGRA